MALARPCLSKALAVRAPALVRPAYASAVPVVASSRSLFSSMAADTTARVSQEGDMNRREVDVTDRYGSDTARRSGRWAMDGLGSTLSQVRPSWRPLLGKLREDEQRYRLRFEVPGLGKDDVRVTVEDGALVIRGEKREEQHSGEEEEDNEQWWSASSYGCYYASLLLPNDARVEGITAEVKDEVLYVMVPCAAPGRGRNVTEVKVQ